jgi:hypothetical protein
MSCPAPCPALPPALLFLALPCPDLPDPFMPYPALPCLALPIFFYHIFFFFQNLPCFDLRTVKEPEN